MRQNVYVGSSVTNASEQLLDFVARFKQDLRLISTAHVIEWVGKDSPMTIHDFYRKDLNNVRNCDVMVAIVDEPSIGLGIEIREALAIHKPLICIHKKGTQVSRLLACARETEEFCIREYTTREEAATYAAEFINGK